MSEILPSWLNKDVPEVEACGLVGYDSDEEIFWVKENDKKSLSFYNSMADVVIAFSGGCCNLSIHESMKSRYKVVNSCLVNDSASEVFFVRNDSSQLLSLEEDFINWQKLYKKVDEENDWKAAYNLIETHPALWSPVSAIPTFLWRRNDGHDYVDQAVVGDDVILDLYFPKQDFSLSVSEDSFEEAYLALGKLIISEFNVSECVLNS